MSAAAIGTILVETASFDPDVTVPNPGQPGSAAGAVGDPVTLPGADSDGGVTVAAIAAGTRIQMLGGTSQSLAASKSGDDVTVQLGTDGGGAETSLASAVVAAIAAISGIGSVLTPSFTGDGSGIALKTGDGTKWISIGQGAKGSNRPAIQKVTNRTRFLAERAGGWDPPNWFYSDDVGTVKLRGLKGLDGILDQGDDETLTASDYLTLGNNKWYYVYAFVSSSAIAWGMFEYPDDALDKYLLARPGHPQHRYVGVFRTDGSAHIVPFFSHFGEYLYAAQQVIATGLTSTTYAGQSLATRIPPHHQGPVKLLGSIIDGSSSPNTLSVRRTGGGGTGQDVATATSGASYRAVEVSCNSSQSIDYGITSASSSSATIVVLGWRDR